MVWRKGYRPDNPFSRFEMHLQVFQIYEFIYGLMFAYFLSKMVETAPLKQKRIQFHNYSTISCGFVRKIIEK
jgi:hypothetical protein